MQIYTLVISEKQSHYKKKSQIPYIFQSKPLVIWIWLLDHSVCFVQSDTWG